MKEIRCNLWKLLIMCILIISMVNAIQAEEKIKLTVSTRKVKFVRAISGTDAGAPMNFMNPFVIFVDKDRNVLYVNTTATGPVFRFDLLDNYKFLDSIADSKELGLTYVLDLNVDKNGNIYVVDAKINKIFVFDQQGVLKQTIVPRDNRGSMGASLSISGVSFSSKGDMYVADKAGNGIQVLDWEGNYLYQIKRARLDQLDFGFPSVSSVKVNSQDEIYLFDNLISKIIKFNLKGKTLAVFGGRGDVAGKFIDAVDITIDNKDRIYVLEAMTGTIQVFDKDGNFLHVLVDENGERLLLSSPEKMVLDTKGNLYVLERMKNQLRIFRFID